MKMLGEDGALRYSVMHAIGEYADELHERALPERHLSNLPCVFSSWQWGYSISSIQVLYEILTLPQGYDTLIGEQGFKLSGGERQRLAIARAILKDAPILLLDEPTAHLDASTEEGILRSLRGVMRGRTTILITHRLVGLDVADEILVLQDGGIQERGMHYELLQAEGLYWKLWTVQNQVIATDV